MLAGRPRCSAQGASSGSPSESLTETCPGQVLDRALWRPLETSFHIDLLPRVPAVLINKSSEATDPSGHVHLSSPQDTGRDSETDKFGQMSTLLVLVFASGTSIGQLQELARGRQGKRSEACAHPSQAAGCPAEAPRLRPFLIGMSPGLLPRPGPRQGFLGEETTTQALNTGCDSNLGSGEEGSFW